MRPVVKKQSIFIKEVQLPNGKVTELLQTVGRFQKEIKTSGYIAERRDNQVR